MQAVHHPSALSGCRARLCVRSRCIQRVPSSPSTARFYSTIYLWLLSRSEIAELTGARPGEGQRHTCSRSVAVEDPSEAFQDMRDKADLGALVSRDVMKGIAAPVDREWARKLQREMKLADVSAALATDGGAHADARHETEAVRPLDRDGPPAADGPAR